MREDARSKRGSKGMGGLRKGLVLATVVCVAFAFAGAALAVDIEPEGYGLAGKSWDYYEQGDAVSSGGYSGAIGYTGSAHVRGTWNSPYVAGIDGFNYNDAQDYVTTGDMVSGLFTSGPHGGYLTSSHRCRECHAVHRAAGEFKLLRSDTRYEACDWCHGTGGGSGYNIQTDNNDAYTAEYNVGHTMGFGISEGKWKAPDDTYPAFTPNYWQGGFSCFDCHSPHANPQRMLGYNDAGVAVGIVGDAGKVYGIANPGHDDLSDSTNIGGRPVYLSGSWLLIKNADREIAMVTEGGVSYYDVDLGSTATTDIATGAEISDKVFAYGASVSGVYEVTAGRLNQFDATIAYPVNKMPIDWNNPIGIATFDPAVGFTERTTDADGAVWGVSEFCTDCHDGNAGLHTVEAPLFSEDRALRMENGSAGPDWRESYDLAYGHDAQSRHACERQMIFDPEDSNDYGPNCRNCHRGSSSCGTCHVGVSAGETLAADNASGVTVYNPIRTSTGGVNEISGGFYKQSRTVDWSTWSANWRRDTRAVTVADVDAICSDDGFSWPHRTLGWKMLKDDLFGLNFDGTQVAVGSARSDGSVAHDIDSVCLDCHNPTIWNATSARHVDASGDSSDDFNDELILRGLP